ncbi:hypothetical protein QJ856_gp0526 [Tupanvirus deep ocean]|uniref:Uncharacterized protein n=2 Tax=Tupanvirus TaxID=2094720 RepID=A0AC62A8Y1_9VIRU|nr:hypothetical protein QJ856_gp0526 [Tupanvirus deep ocean]QKU34220.1 hypothetical protein [Tupanvirus deep ocean]
MPKHSAAVYENNDKKSKTNKNSKTHKNKQSKKPSNKKYIKEEEDDDIMDNSGFDIDEVDDFEPEEADNTNEEYNEDDEYEDDFVDDDNEVEVKPKKNKLDDKTVQRLKNKIVDWLDYDDKIKTLNNKSKKYKDAKKQLEELIIKMITKLEVEDMKIDVHDDQNNFRSRVYRHKSVTKEALKENIIKDALMEAIRDEKKVDQLVKKIDSKRPIKERYYLKRTKGNKNE